MLKKTCAHCGKTFSKKATTSTREWNEQTKFCSRPCYWAAKRILPALQELVALYSSGLSSLAIAERYSASESSVYEQLVKAGIKFRHPSDYNRPQCRPRSFGTCEMCGHAFGRAFKRGGTGKPRRFCSRACKVAWYRGERVATYLGHPDHYYGSSWQDNCARIRARDRVCRRCAKTVDGNGKELDVHHVVPSRVSENHSDTNLITLCAACHTTVESRTRHMLDRHLSLTKLKLALLKEFPWLTPTFS